MEPLTHMLTGAVLARTGFNRKAAYGVAAMTIAAELPDIDTAWGLLGGPVVGFEHHRGFTHTFVALPAEAAIVVAGCWAWRRFRPRETKAPVNWGWLYGGCLVALLSHILLDWTNNYGVRPFFPFNPRWYEGSFVFIVEPVLYVLLAGALVMPWLFGLINSEVGARKTKFGGRGWAIAALMGVAALYALRYTEHGKAIAIAQQNAPAGATRFFASPNPANPFVWHTVADLPEAYQRRTVNTFSGTMLEAIPADTIYKPVETLALMAAKRSFVGRVYLDWSSWPLMAQTEVTDDPRHPLTEVTFTDARFLYDTILLQGTRRPPLGATVLLDMAAPEGDRVVEMSMDGKMQK